MESISESNVELVFGLFFVRVTTIEQLELFRQPISSYDILKKLVELSPSDAPERRRQWHIGDLEGIGDDQYYFRIGRTTKRTRSVFKEGRFIEMSDQEDPFAHAVIDVRNELLAISNKALLGKSTTVANQFGRLLSGLPLVDSVGARIVVTEIREPRAFLKLLRQASRVSRFAATFHRPNPIDTEELFQRPSEQLLKATKGAKGKTIIDGEMLDQKVLEKITRGLAARGDDADAWLKLPGEKIRKHSLKGNPGAISHEEPTDSPKKSTLLQKALKKFFEIKNGDGE